MSQKVMTMRTLSLSLIGTLILLLGGSTVAMATDEPVAAASPSS